MLQGRRKVRKVKDDKMLELMHMNMVLKYIAEIKKIINTLCTDKPVKSLVWLEFLGIVGKEKKEKGSLHVHEEGRASFDKHWKRVTQKKDRIYDRLNDG